MAKRNREASIDGPIKKQCIPSKGEWDNLGQNLLAEILKYARDARHQNAALLPQICKKWKFVYEQLDKREFISFASTEIGIKKIAFFCMLEMSEAGLMHLFSAYMMVQYYAEEILPWKRQACVDVTFHESFQIVISEETRFKERVEKHLDLKEGVVTKQELVQRADLIMRDGAQALTGYCVDENDIPLKELLVPYKGRIDLSFEKLGEALKIPEEREKIYRLVMRVNHIRKLW